MLPLLENLAVELAGKAEIVKFNCNKHNKELGQSLGIKVAPTFHVYRDEKQVGVWGTGVQLVLDGKGISVPSYHWHC